MQEIEDHVRRLGVNTFPIPLGLKRNEADPVASKCVRCDTCDGYPCLVHAKSDSDINCIRQIMHLPNVTLMTNSRVVRLLTNASGTAVESVEVIHSGVFASKQGATATYTAGIFAVCAGAINSAVILLASANDKHPNGLANSSDQVGRNFMYHQADALLALSTKKNEDSYTKTWGTNDFYLKDTDPKYPYPLGQVQPVGSFHHEMMKGDAPPLTPGFVLETMKQHAVPWWLTTEDLPSPENRVTIENATPLSIDNAQPGVAGAHPSGDTGRTNESEMVNDHAPHRIKLAYTPNNVESFNRLKDRWVDVLKRAGHADTHVPLHAYFKKRIPLEGVGHQNGTCRMGDDPATSVLDAKCKAHDLDNLYGRGCILLRLCKRGKPVTDDHCECNPGLRSPARGAAQVIFATSRQGRAGESAAAARTALAHPLDQELGPDVQLRISGCESDAVVAMLEEMHLRRHTGLHKCRIERRRCSSPEQCCHRWSQRGRWAACPWSPASRPRGLLAAIAPGRHPEDTFAMTRAHSVPATLMTG